MTTLAETSLRRRLRDETHPVHAALDKRVSQFDLQTLAGLRAYLGMHASALEGLLHVVRPSETKDAIANLYERSTRDLTRLGERPHCVSLGFTPDRDAVDYVVLGSRLGSAVLKKRWLGATDPDVLAIDAHFSAPSYIPLWQAFCDRVAKHPAKASDKIVADANALFAYFDRCIPAADKGIDRG